jgi:hypothetical protein
MDTSLFFVSSSGSFERRANLTREQRQQINESVVIRAEPVLDRPVSIVGRAAELCSSLVLTRRAGQTPADIYPCKNVELAR